MIGSLQPPFPPSGAVPVKLKLSCVDSNFQILDKLRHFALKVGFSNNIFDLSSISILLCFLWKGVVLEAKPQMNEVLM